MSCEGWGIGGTDSGSSPVLGFGINGVESSSPTAKELVHHKVNE